ncbi:MAG: tRNA pseudouridine(38-40) synthase TruA [Fimbriimonadaceae bacterium]|nr:tRNA pseudouridine(38-40) synthase TruA [Fimbriimonadaceae bacterium]QYK56779.1 MAG: tRNA pseudouridine(38-40) synthase TruA [Fimbriimonadaceae bacterium]
MSGTDRKRIKLVVAYDGADFCGWAPQRGRRTVHGTLTEAVRRITGEETEVTGASRTDAGAHAKGAVCHFDAPSSIPARNLPRALNDLLPTDIAVTQARDVPREFHARHWAVDRWYRYRILCGPRDPHRARYVFHHGRELELEPMIVAAGKLVGQHDFLAFTQELEPGENTVRTLKSLLVRRVRDEVWVDVVGIAFARGMMRRISGMLWEIGRGRRGLDSVPRLLAARQSGDAEHRPKVLPASGLCLMKVSYGKRPRDQRGRFEERED